MDKIFIQIASYRDPELVPTIKDCLDNASDPEALVFGICRQFHEDDGFDSLEEYKDDPRFRIKDIPHNETKGTCWARNQIQQLYEGEKYTLQLDSHHRFTKDWDDQLKKMFHDLVDLGYQKPLLTAYISSYNPRKDPEERVQEPWQMNFDRFIPEGAVFFMPSTIENWEKLKYPVPARFYSAHFCFTWGKFCEEVQHDPEYYFHGEEISIAARAYTHGYDMFHPHKVVIWHEYTRKGRTKQWDDDSDWGNKNASSHLRNRKLFGMDGLKRDIEFGKYGFGSQRSLQDYEIYSGLHFAKRAIQQWTKDDNYPPNPNTYKSQEEWEESFLKIFKHCIDLDKNQVPENDYDFWVVAFHDKKGETIHRRDVVAEEMPHLYNDPDGYIKIFREFETNELPYEWVVWPHSKSKEWMDRLSGRIFPEDTHQENPATPEGPSVVDAVVLNEE
jgi:glycosyltransferase involved in cell wall biosynthesis